jgi:hypothetical protein
MYKAKVDRTWIDSSGLVLVQTTKGPGSEHPKPHPFAIVKIGGVQGSNIKFEGVREGDLLRCDSLPYMSRPSPIYSNDYKYETYTKAGRKFMRSKALYWPVKLPNGFWVLREQR